ncbi:GATA transcription factor 8-like isoform X1 [Syzygium oleosum]|uniref:GATA transcription factor 8-like isoform X1 n=1 Tax=Syzygium oleosum TaxID=219896 RepID=UPI0011D1A64F|nr:GATA transcription factor 8-like isoform X1 [Syzygium oleosum]
MPGQNMMEEIDCGSFFDQIDDLLDFPNDDVEAGLPPIDRDSFPSIWSAHPDSLPVSGSVFGAHHHDSDLSVPYEDIDQLEWFSPFVEGSFSGDALAINEQDSSETQPANHAQFQTSSPVSVLDSSSSCTDEKTAPRSPEAITLARCGRARSKRPRPATFNPRPPVVQLISPTSSVGENLQLFDSESHVESRPMIKIPRQVNPEQKKKKKKIKFTLSTASAAAADASQNLAPAQAVRKCMHCEITKTPQWRAGPMGPKTLCNACGVRYKSGRLFPEYRPAASPTFVPALHSNSHKKVLEMRTKVGDPEAMANPPELIPNPAIEMEYM